MSKNNIKFILLLLLFSSNSNAYFFEFMQLGISLIARNASSRTQINATQATVINSNMQKGTVNIGSPAAPAWPEVAKTYQVNLTNQAYSLFDCVKKNKYKLAGANLVAIYLYNNGKLIYLENSLKNKNCWSEWNSKKNLNQLLEYPQTDLSKELIFEIQKRYTNPNQPMDFIRPLIQFAKTIDNERKDLEIYQRNCNLIKKIKLSRVFKINDELLQDIQHRMSRLTYLNNIFINWLATCKLEQNKIN